MSQLRHFISRSEAEPPLYVGIDVGGTNIKVGVVDDRGRSLSWHSVPTHAEQGPENAARRMGEAVQEAVAAAKLQPGEVVWAGLGTPGTMDISRGMLLDPPNLPGWSNFPIRDRVSAHCRLPVAFANDANAAAYGEFWVGSGRHFHSMVLFTLGTGVGGGIIIGDVSIDGENSAGSELGHIIINYNDDALLCPCGKTGHLEAYCSATAVVKRTLTALAGGRTSSLRARVDGGEDLTTIMVAEEAERGDDLSLDIILETARLLGVGAVSVMHTIDPAGVVFGGAMNFGGHETSLGRLFLERIREEVRARAFPMLSQRTSVDYATLGGDAGYIGAAGIARLAHKKK